MGWAGNITGRCSWRRVCFGWQQKLIFNRDRDNCFKAFMNNNYVGLVLFLGLAMSYL
ncbi:4-hydroxybenzoate polyprenyltransferase [Klebsiella pneumoniae]|uniref:4-hydroxybenzoate polyprenyltransferase n=1 Tax=Klebsiella pneumoniae TaxID=573 RepID=A0A3S4ISG1_KLEPN|nr:4-hydroxybenzoate polyprenyltransferase [Klebsiella pneumoniae]